MKDQLTCLCDGHEEAADLRVGHGHRTAVADLLLKGPEHRTPGAQTQTRHAPPIEPRGVRNTLLPHQPTSLGAYTSRVILQPAPDNSGDLGKCHRQSRQELSLNLFVSHSCRHTGDSNACLNICDNTCRSTNDGA